MQSENDIKLVGGFWMPATEQHLTKMMVANPKGNRIVDGFSTYQYQKLEAALRHVKKFRVAIDIGGHVGLWSKWLQPKFERLVAFEPIPLHADLFERNVKMDNVELHRIALGNLSGLTDFEVPEQTTGNSHVAVGTVHPGTHGVTDPTKIKKYSGIRIEPLDSFNLADVDFVKIDVEGYEKNVILGAEKTIRSCKPIVIIEQKKNESVYGEPPDAATNLMKKWGMRSAQNISGDHIMVWAA